MFDNLKRRQPRRGQLVGAALGLLWLASAPDARAHHVVWLDFSDFNLNSWASVNGHTPPTANDRLQIQAQIVVNMVQDYASFDIMLTTLQPANGRYTRLRILGSDQGGLYGCAGNTDTACTVSVCPSCTGIGSWDEETSHAEVYAGSFSKFGDFTSANATTARLANGISHTASHELGHTLDLLHCHAADDSITLGCTDIDTTTNDLNATWHVMASGSSWGLTTSQRATRDRFFSVHASRRILYGNLQARNHFENLDDLGGDGLADLSYGRFQSPTTTTWYRRFSDGTEFSGAATASTDAGNAGHVFLLGDVSGDGRADLVYGELVSATQVRWRVRKASAAGSFGTAAVWRESAGDVGDIFRLGDVDADGRDDLVYGRPLASDTIRWFGRLSNGAGFGNYTTWRSDAGDEGDLFFLADGDADGDADLLYGRAVSSTQVKWFGRKSNGSSFGNYSTWREDAGDVGDAFSIGDVGGDGDADLVYGRTNPDENDKVSWYVRDSTGSGFDGYVKWASDGGDAGDLFRLGDADGDGRNDLFYGRPLGMTSLSSTPDLTHIHWFGRRSEGAGFASWATWSHDAGDEGDLIP